MAEITRLTTVLIIKDLEPNPVTGFIVKDTFQVFHSFSGF